MSWFIFSEVMFFAGFFGALWYVRTITTPWLGDLDHKLMLWPDFQAVWPNFGPAGVVEHFQTVGPFWLPTINTALLLSSGVTLTIAHHALRENHRGKTIFWLLATVVLGFIFVACRGGIPSCLYRAEPEVQLGRLRLAVLHADGLPRLPRAAGRHHADRDPDSPDPRPLHGRPSLRLRGRGRYWHFVDVVWLGLYLFVYWM